MMAEDAAIGRVAELLQGSRRAVAFTGAGISTESGIPDFRSPSGIWSRYTPIPFDEFLASDDARYEYWRQRCEMYPDFAAAQPNAGHFILAKWQLAEWLRTVITQNIDGLHQLAGSPEVFELHGTARRIGCLSCPAKYEVEPIMDRFRAEDRAPTCEACGGWLKHATVSFGQALPADVFQWSAQHCRQADLVLILGTSLVVEPAARLPRLAQERGAKLVLINREETPLDSLATVVLRSEIGPTLSEIDSLLRVD